MKAEVKWIELGWKHPLWDVVRFYLSLRGTKAPSSFRTTLSQKKAINVNGQFEFPIDPEVCRLFEEYLTHRETVFKAVFDCLRTEGEANSHCSRLKATVKSTTTQRDHHQSSKAMVAAVSSIAATVCVALGKSIDTNPQTRCVWCLNNGLHVSARNLDGAVPSLYNPKAIWEIKEYWGKTSGGSKMSDAVYECHLVGLEMRYFEEKIKSKVDHVVFVDGREQWTARKSDLKRFIDLMNQGLIDQLFVGRMVETDWMPSLTELLSRS